MATLLTQEIKNHIEHAALIASGYYGRKHAAQAEHAAAGTDNDALRQALDGLEHVEQTRDCNADAFDAYFAEGYETVEGLITAHPHLEAFVPPALLPQEG